MAKGLDLDRPRCSGSARVASPRNLNQKTPIIFAQAKFGSFKVLGFSSEFQNLPQILNRPGFAIHHFGVIIFSFIQILY